MIHRRKLIIALATGALANPFAARAQRPPAKTFRGGSSGRRGSQAWSDARTVRG